MVDDENKHDPLLKSFMTKYEKCKNMVIIGIAKLKNTTANGGSHRIVFFRPLNDDPYCLYDMSCNATSLLTLNQGEKNDFEESVLADWHTLFFDKIKTFFSNA